MRLQDYDRTRRFEATVHATDRLTPEDSDAEVRELVLEVPGHLDVDPGQSVGVLAPGDAALGQDHHFRLYTIADVPEHVDGDTRLRIAVKRVSYLDPYSGERSPGRASSYLCDLRPGDRVTLTGPYGLAFAIPVDADASLVLIGAGTGIAPFRAFLKALYARRPDWEGRVLLFHGARTGLDALYQNRERDDFAQYYDRGTFEAIRALANRPHWSEQVDWDAALEGRSEELRRLLDSPSTYVYVAGVEDILDRLDEAFVRLVGSKDRWRRRKAELEAGGRWVQLIY